MNIFPEEFSVNNDKVFFFNSYIVNSWENEDIKTIISETTKPLEIVKYYLYNAKDHTLKFQEE